MTITRIATTGMAPETMDDFRNVTFVSGDVEPAGHHVRLRIETDSAQAPIDLRLPATDLSHLINLLLMLGSRVPPKPTYENLEGTTQAIPLPLRGVSLGTSDDGDTLLLFDVGPAVLAFDLAPESVAGIGRALLAMSVPTVQPS